MSHLDFIFTNIKAGIGVAEVAAFIIEAGGLAPKVLL